MLTLTDNATTVVATLVSRQSEAIDAGLRIQTAEGTGPNGESRFAVSVVSAPDPSDQVVTEGAGRVFLEPAAAEVLDDKILDAGVDDEGAVSFTLLPQAA